MSGPRSDPLAPWRPGAGTWVALAGAGLLVLVYPFVLPRLLEALGARAVALLLLGPVGATFLWRRPTAGAVGSFEVPFLGALRATVVALAAGALLQGDPRLLLAVPVAIQLFLCAVFARSLSEPHSVIERAARFLQPRAPGFVGPYCRVVTALWAALFAVNAAVLGVLVVREGAAGWSAFAGWGVYAALGVLSAFEYLFRKAWFRHYGPGPLDRLWARLLPPERTERGRRSLAYIRHMHDEMRADGFEPPAEATPR